MIKPERPAVQWGVRPVPTAGQEAAGIGMEHGDMPFEPRDLKNDFP